MADKAPIEVEGGAKIEEVELQPLVPPVEGDAISVVTTAPGTLGIMGIVPVGTEAEVTLQAYSDAWMKPRTKADKAKLDKFRKG